jgi:hypothetical protein
MLALHGGAGPGGVTFQVGEGENKAAGGIIGGDTTRGLGGQSTMARPMLALHGGAGPGGRDLSSWGRGGNKAAGGFGSAQGPGPQVQEAIG